MKIQVTLDLDRLLADRKAKEAFERFFGHFPPDERELLEVLGDKKTLDSMISYMVVKTIFNDDGKGQAYKVLGLPVEQKELGR